MEEFITLFKFESKEFVYNEKCKKRPTILNSITKQ